MAKRPKLARILLIDDDNLVRLATEMALTSNGFDVVAVADGKSGVAAFMQEQFDLVIVDLFMPGMNGLQTATAIRSASPRVPIIAASGFMSRGPKLEMPNFAEMAREAGATTILYKPFQPEVLVQAIQDAIGVAGAAA
jgi:CheY-like chemotaxis protein